MLYNTCRPHCYYFNRYPLPWLLVWDRHVAYAIVARKPLQNNVIEILSAIKLCKNESPSELSYTLHIKISNLFKEYKYDYPNEVILIIADNQISYSKY